MEENISSKIKLEDKYKPDKSQTENVISEVTSGEKINSNTSCIKQIDQNCEKQSSEDNNMNNNCHLPSTIKTELNNNFNRNIATFNNKMNCLNKLPPKTEEDNKITDKNEENTDRNKASDTFNKVKGTKEETMSKKINEATKKNRPQVNQKYATKVVKNNQNKSERPKKIKITINITYNNVHSKNNVTSTNVDGDLSFLDDFDVDEVVESLFNSKEQNNLNIKTNIDIEEKITENSKKRKTTSTEQINRNHKESCSKHTSRVDNKTEETKKANIEKEKSPASIATENNKGKNLNGEVNCSVIPKKIDKKSESGIISTESKNCF
ncbi:hypothetical protein RR48_11871 [Papilio machaon]|uniref:Uncharacterized protein n=1 Tax=Papilio machaon TaxID=76193 RepID=A0A194RJL6_PAPMA|nr:hypothetical protein RR48_11871 [Papilio machaon]